MESVSRGGNKKIMLALLAVVMGFSGRLLAQTAPLPTTVTVVPLSELVIDQQAFAQATVVAANRARVAAQVAAEVRAVRVDVGDVVSKGEVLAELNQQDYQLALEQAQAAFNSIEAQIAQAKYRLKRARELSGSQYISADDLLARETDVAVLTANRVAQQVAIRIARNNLERTRIVAPFDAAVVARNAQQGSYVTVAAPMFDLVELAGAEVEAQVPMDLVVGISGSSRIYFARAQQQWPLTLLRITPVVESDSGTQAVRLGFSGAAAPIGSSGQVRWSDGRLLLPADMILQRDGKLGVFIAHNSKARFVSLPSAQEGRPAVVALPATTLVVTAGRFRIADGQDLDLQLR